MFHGSAGVSIMFGLNDVRISPYRLYSPCLPSSRKRGRARLSRPSPLVRAESRGLILRQRGPHRVSIPYSLWHAAYYLPPARRPLIRTQSLRATRRASANQREMRPRILSVSLSFSYEHIYLLSSSSPIYLTKARFSMHPRSSYTFSPAPWRRETREVRLMASVKIFLWSYVALRTR